MEKKDQKKGISSPSGVFKIGSISLAFLIIGYQSALFIHRAAILHIEANRDHPDTIYVVDEAIAAKLLHPSLPESMSLREETKPVIRKESKHSKAVKEVRARSRKVENFHFNPNTVSIEDLQRLGFSEKQARAIDNYRTKGGRFHRPSDFAKSLVVADSVYNRLQPFITIPKLDINLADSAALDALPGIGPYLAVKIIAYRQELGGFTNTEQLMDIKYFDRERYDALADLITCSTADN